MDFLKKFIKNVLPVNQIIKFIIKQFLSSYLIYNENDFEENAESESGIKNLINIPDLELNVANINNKHLLYSPIKLLKGKFGVFKLDIDDDNKIIVTIEDACLDLMPIFNFYKKYQETIFNIEEKQKKEMINNENKNKTSEEAKDNKNQNQVNDQKPNNYMLTMANKLLTNLEININNISVRLFTYEINEKIIDNPVFTLFIMNINIYKSKDEIKTEAIIDPNTYLPFEKSFLDNLIIDFDKLCLKVNRNINQKDMQEFAEIKQFCKKNNKNLTKEQQNKILNFFIDYNTIFAINYKKDSSISIKLNTIPRKEKYKIKENGEEKEKEKIVEDMNIMINIAEVEAIITPNQLFDIQILYQISNFIFSLNKNTPNSIEENSENKKEENKEKNKDKEKDDTNSDSDSTKDKEKSDNNDDNQDDKMKFSLMFKKFDKKEKIKEDNHDQEEEENEDNIFNEINDNKDDLSKGKKFNTTSMSLVPKKKKVETPKKEINENTKTEILTHELSKFTITMNCKRIVLVLLENKDNESIPKLFSFLMEDEIISKKNKEDKNITNIIFGEVDSPFENYYCYFEDNILLLKIEDIKSINTCINVNSIITEYIQPLEENENDTNKKNEKNKSSNINKAQLSIYESAVEFSDSDGENEVFQSALECTQLLILENYQRFINKYISGQYKSTKFEILTINKIKFDMNEKSIFLNEIFLNLNYMIIILFTKLLTQVRYFINFDGKKIYTIDDSFHDENNLNINLEKKINDSEVQLFHNLKKKHRNNLDESDSEDGDGEIFEESIGYSEEERNKKDGMKIKINFISIKINNIANDPQRFDSNIYYFNLFQNLVFPNLSTIAGAKLKGPEKQSFSDILSKDFIELNLIDMDLIYYDTSNLSNMNIVFKELLFKYWNETIIKYSNINSKNELNGNPNISLSFPVIDIVVNFSEEIIMNIDKNTLDNLLSFVNEFLYGLSMYQIYDKYCTDLFNNKLINLFDLFGLKNLIKAFKNIETDEEKIENKEIDKKISYDKKALKEIGQQMMKKKPNMSIGGKISCLIININKNKSFDENEGNLVKIKMNDISVSLEMFNTDDNNINNNNNEILNNNLDKDNKKVIKEDKNKEKEIEEPIYNIVTLSINNIFFLIKEKNASNSEPSYYTLFSKNKSSQYEATDYFFMTFKFRNLKKINDDITIVELDEEYSDEEDLDPLLDKKASKESDNTSKKNYDIFKKNNTKITLDPKTTDYINFLLKNQVKLDNMEMVVDIKISEIIINSFYDKINLLENSLTDLFVDFTEQKNEKLGPFANPADRIPLCEDRIMFFKCNFITNHLLIDIFMKEDIDKKKWMRILLLIDNFKFTFNEIGIFISFDKNYIYILKDFSYICFVKEEHKDNILDIDDKLDNIHKEESYIKRIGYVELFYNDKIEFNKMEKEMNINLGNINIFLCKDSYDFIYDFIQIFSEKYLEKFKNMFSIDENNLEDNDEEIEENEEKDNITNVNLKKEEINEEKKKKDEFKDFELVDDVFFIDDTNKYKKIENTKNKKNISDNIYSKYRPNKLETIEEVGKQKKSKSNDVDIAVDDFAIIETKTSLQRKIKREQNEEDAVTYTLQIDSFRLYLFQGSDFDFESSSKEILDIINISPKDKSENDEALFQNDSSQDLLIDNNYLFKITVPRKKKLLKKRRKRKNFRDHSNYILLNLIDMNFKIIDFSDFDFTIRKFFIDDNFENSQYKKIISKKDFISENSQFLKCKLELIKNNNDSNINNNTKNKIKDNITTNIRIYLNIPSLDIFVDQLPLMFIIKLFLSYNYDKNEENKEKDKHNKKKIIEDSKSNEENYEKNLSKKNDKKILSNININNKEGLNTLDSFNSWNEVFENSNNNDNTKNINDENNSNSLILNDIDINSFTINFHYNSHKMSFSKLYSQGDWIQLLSGLSDIKELNLKFKRYVRTTPLPLPDAILEIINFWKDDIISNQVTNSALRGFSITRPFFKLYDGVKDLVKQPYLSYKKNEGIKHGIKRGMKNFLVSFSSQGIFFGEKIFRGVKIVMFRKTKLSLKKKSLYKTWVYKINKKQHDYEMYYYKQK